MNSLSSLIVLAMMPFYLVSANQSAITVSPDESTEHPNEYYEHPQSSEEAYQEYSKFQTAFARQFRPQQHAIVTPLPIVEPFSSIAISDPENDSLISQSNVDELVPATTLIVPVELPLNIIQSSTLSSDLSETAAKLIGDFTNMSDTTIIADANNTDELSSKHAKMYVANEPDDEPVYRPLSLTDNLIRKMTEKLHDYSNPIPNESAMDDISSVDYVNDGSINNDTNESQSITAQYYPMDTTIASIVPLPIQIQSTDRLSIYTAAASTILTTTAVPTTTTTNVPLQPQNVTGNRKSPKKIETSNRIYKYSADEILRKYLEDTYIRAPMASLINTSPEALRKAKILWKSALRPNTPIDIVLLAFNSSGKYLHPNVQIYICIVMVSS